MEANVSVQNHPALLQRAAVADLSIGDLIEAATQYVDAGEPALARQLYRAWIEHNRENPLLYVAHFNCSALDSQAGDAAGAIESLKQAIALNADFLPAYINLGGLLERSGAPDRAVELWNAVANRPAKITGNVVTYTSAALKQMARVLYDRHQSESAEAAIQLCVDINPNQKDVIEQYAAMRLLHCKWPVLVSRENLHRKAQMKGMHPLSMSIYTDDPLLQLATADRYLRTSGLDAPQDLSFDRRRARIDVKNRRLRIGYVSSDLRDHAIGCLMAEVFELHNRKNVEVFAYYCGPETANPLTSRIQANVEHWINIRNMSDDDAARKIAADGIDILIDVNGHTRDARTGVFARRPAPVQVNWLGYPGSMASPYHHYIIADEWIIPPSSEIYFSEKVVRLPCYQPNDRKRVVAPRPTRQDTGLPENAFVFCCFNGTQKISRFTFERWTEILARVPQSVLWLLEASPETKKRLWTFAESKGIARERIIFAPKMANPQHLARYVLADLFLDTAPYGAHTTASDALWMGVPVLTLSGRSFASRVCGSLVRSAGLKDLVVTSPADYVERAVLLAKSPAKIADYKQKLEAGRRTCQLFDMEKLVRRLEGLYRTMAENHNKGRTPQPDLDNLEAYLEAGIDYDHEAQEMLAAADYHSIYRAKLTRLHLARPLHTDKRLWTRQEIARAESGKASRDRENPSRRQQKMRSGKRRTKR